MANSNLDSQAEYTVNSLYFMFNKSINTHEGIQNQYLHVFTQTLPSHETKGKESLVKLIPNIYG